MSSGVNTSVFAPNKLTSIGFDGLFSFIINGIPREMGETEIAAFLTHLARDGRVAASTQNQALSALLFLYKEVLKQTLGSLQGVERAKRPVSSAVGTDSR